MTTPKSPAKPTKVDDTKAGSKWDKNLKKGWVIISGKRYVKTEVYCLLCCSRAFIFVVWHRSNIKKQLFFCLQN